MATDMFLKIEGVNGESNDDSHADEIEVLAWSWGMSQSGTFHTGGGGGAGKVNVQDLSITKYVDSATSNLLAKCSTGEHYDDAILTVRKAGGDPLEYLVITMKRVMVTSVSTGGSGGEDRLTENITLNFAEVSAVYTPQEADGSGGAEMTYDYDIQANKLG